MGLGSQLQAKNEAMTSLTTVGTSGGSVAPVSQAGFNPQNIPALQSIPPLTQTELSDVRTNTSTAQSSYRGKEVNQYGLSKPPIPSGPEYPNQEVNQLVTE